MVCVDIKNSNYIYNYILLIATYTGPAKMRKIVDIKVRVPYSYLSNVVTSCLHIGHFSDNGKSWKRFSTIKVVSLILAGVRSSADKIL